MGECSFLFSIKKDKIVFVCFLFISLIGLSTGINYQKQLTNTSVEIIKKSFEFGLFGFFYGEKLFKIFVNIIISCLKHFFVFFVSGLSWFFYPVIPLNLFGICFKLGIVLSYITSILKIKGFFEISVLIFLLFFIIVLFSFLCTQITIQKIKNSIQKINYIDKEFTYKNVLLLVLMIIGIIFIYFLGINIKFSLYGLFKTIM